MKKIKISFVGAGFMSQIAHIVNFKKDSRVQLCDIADLDIDLARDVKKYFNFKGLAYHSIKNIIANKPDGVVIVVQRPLITHLVKKFLSAKINVLSEKPHALSLMDYNECARKQKNSIWLKGYNRRWDLSAVNLKENFEKYSKGLGNLIYISCYIDAGDTYLKSKHYIKPKKKKNIFRGELNSYPKWLASKYKKFYEQKWNFISHFIDLLDFFNINKFTNIKTYINDNLFTSTFNSKMKKYSPVCNLITLNTKHSKWVEKMTFHFNYGKIILSYNAPMYKKSSSRLTIYNQKFDKTRHIEYKNKWTFEQQAKGFVDLIKNKKNSKFYYSKDGKASIQNYEKIWKEYLKKNK